MTIIVFEAVSTPIRSLPIFVVARLRDLNI